MHVLLLLFFAVNPTFGSSQLLDNEIVKYKGEDTVFGCSAVGFPLKVNWEIKQRHAESWKTLGK